MHRSRQGCDRCGTPCTNTFCWYGMPHQHFLLVRHAAPIKSEDKILRKCLKKTKFVLKRHPGKLHHFFIFFRNRPAPLPGQLSASKLNFAALVKKIWLHLRIICTGQTDQSHVTVNGVNPLLY